MRSTTRVLALFLPLAALALPATHAPAAAAAKPIRGKLTEPGYTVIALAANGKARSTKARPRFKLRPPARRISLHLRARDGTYAGPIVLSKQRRGRRVVTGVKAGARLGRIKVRSGRGFGKANRVRKRWRDPARWARARRGVPIGNGVNFGRVRSRLQRKAVPGDPDLDGVPNRLDVDNDGDLILDPVDRAPRRRGSRSGRRSADRAALRVRATQGANSTFQVATVMPAGPNANATTLSDADIDAALSRSGYLILGILPGNPELDCGGQPDPDDPDGWIGGLIYCTRGGTGSVFGGPSHGQPFPGPSGGVFDTDGDGLGTPFNNGGPPPGFFFFSHGATSSQIGTGDVLIQRSTSGDSQSEATVLLPFVFATSPALVSYDDGAGNSATVEHPVAPSDSEPGTQQNPFPVRARSNGDVIVTLTLWRPQRKPIASEPGDWIDIGGLAYAAKTHFTDAPSCPQGAFSENDPNLAPAGFDIPTGPAGLLDLAADRPASPANTFTFSLNLTRCRGAHGQSLEPGETATVSLSGVTVETGSNDGTRGQTDLAVSFKRQP